MSETQNADGLIADEPLENPEAAAAEDDPEQTSIPHVAETPDEDAGLASDRIGCPKNFGTQKTACSLRTLQKATR